MRIWGDEKFRALSKPQPNGQSLFMYLLTGPHTGVLPGLASIGEAALAESLRWPLEQFRSAYQEIDTRGMAEVDWTAPLVFLPNGMKYNPPESPNVVRAWRSAFDDLPDCVLKEKAFQAFEDFVEGLTEAFRKAFEKPSVRSSLIKSKSSNKNKNSNQREIGAPVPAGFNLDPIYFETLDQLPRFREHRKLREPAWWQSMILAYPHIDHIEELKKAHGWLVTSAKGKLRRDLAGFLRNWFERAETEEG